MTAIDHLPPAGLSDEARTLILGGATGLTAATIGAVHVVFARWGIQHGASAMDLTALRFGVAGIVLPPVLARALQREPQSLRAKSRVWLAVSALARTPFGLLMFGALQFAPASHAAVFPFAAMSIMGMLIGSLFLGDPPQPIARRRGPPNRAAARHSLLSTPPEHEWRFFTS